MAVASHLVHRKQANRTNQPPPHNKWTAAPPETTGGRACLVASRSALFDSRLVTLHFRTISKELVSKQDAPPKQTQNKIPQNTSR